MPSFVIVDQLVKEYQSELVAAGMGYLATSPRGRKLIFDLARTEVVYRGKQADILARYLAGSVGLQKGGKTRRVGKSLVRKAPGAARFLASKAGAPLALGTGTYLVGTAVGKSPAVRKAQSITLYMPLGGPV